MLVVKRCSACPQPSHEEQLWDSARVGTSSPISAYLAIWGIPEDSRFRVGSHAREVAVVGREGALLGRLVGRQEGVGSWQEAMESSDFGEIPGIRVLPSGISTSTKLGWSAWMGWGSPLPGRDQAVAFGAFHEFPETHQC